MKRRLQLGGFHQHATIPARVYVDFSVATIPVVILDHLVARPYIHVNDFQWGLYKCRSRSLFSSPNRIVIHPSPLLPNPTPIYTVFFLSSSFLFLTASSIDVDADTGAGSSSSASTRSRPIAIPRSRQNSVASTVTIPEALSARGERQGCV
jgi:hypothetical protein